MSTGFSALAGVVNTSYQYMIGHRISIGVTCLEKHKNHPRLLWKSRQGGRVTTRLGLGLS